MTSRDFCYWLQGFFEIGGESVKSLDDVRVEMIKKHLNMVFVHEIDPSHGGPEMQAKLNEIHNGTPDQQQQVATFLNDNPHLRPGNGAIFRC